VILRTIFRMIWVVTSFGIAALVAPAVLFALGALWVGDELRAAAPNDPLLEQGAPIFGAVMFAGTVGPALTALPP
jgi:ABC-type transporter Mla maintaining outer membrane lipid asymmetry permease subunit MlaE